MFKTLYILAALLLGSSFSAHAEWSKQYDLAYTMGDGDTKGSARQAAIEQIKLKASNEAGTYVDSTTALKEDGNLTESIQMIRATMVKVRVDKESMSINPSGQPTLNLVVFATLDDAELAKRVEALRQDKVKARQVKDLQDENEALRASLSKIRLSLAAQSDPATVSALIAQQDQTIRKLDLNSQSVTQVFSKGTLLQLAMKNNDAFEYKKKDLEDTLYAYLMSAPVRANLEGVEQNGDGYIALVRVGWDIDLAKVGKMLEGSLSHVNRELHGRSRSNRYVNASSFHNEEGKGNNNLSPRVFDFLAQHAVIVKVSIGGEETVLPMLYGAAGRSVFDPCDDFYRPSSRNWKRPKSVCVTNLGFDEKSVLGSGAHQTNPLRISLTKAQAESATTVTASIEVMTEESEDARFAERLKQYELERESASRAEMERRAIEVENYRKQRVYLDKRAIRSGMGIPSYAY